MSSLSNIEKRKLEELFDMSSGYVSSFSDRTFGELFVDVVNIDIHSEKYRTDGTSKAKKLRKFWEIESDYLTGRIILALIEDMESRELDDSRQKVAKQCKEIGHRLLAGNINLNNLKKTAIVFDAKHITDQVRRMEQAIDTDPALAIGTAKELIETCCKTILAERGIAVSECPDIPTLTKRTLKELKLVPDGVTEETRGADIIKRLLQNLGTIGNNLAELRGLYGTGHGKHGSTEGLRSRHAKLAVGASATLVTFLFDTHKERRNEQSKT